MRGILADVSLTPQSLAPQSRYRLLERIAVGGNAEIFLAHDSALDRRVVIKYLLEVGQAETDRLSMFLEEARAVARCEHPNIVKIFDIGVDRERYFMALEHLEGWELSQVWKRANALGAPVPVPIAVRLMMDAAQGLHAAHEARSADGRPLALVHRDVSPRNLFVVRDGVLKLLDFGIAKTTAGRNATQVGTVKGTLAYMSPEQCRSEPLDRRSDVFSLGVILHELLSGQRLFKRGTPFATMAAIANEPVVPPIREGGLPERLVAVTSRALSRSADMRFPTAAAFSEALAAATRGDDAPANRDDVERYLRATLLDATDIGLVPPVAPKPATRETAWADEAIVTSASQSTTSPTVDLGMEQEVPARAQAVAAERRRVPIAAVVALVAVVAALGIMVARSRQERSQVDVAAIEATPSGTKVEAAPGDAKAEAASSGATAEAARSGTAVEAAPSGTAAQATPTGAAAERAPAPTPSAVREPMSEPTQARTTKTSTKPTKPRVRETVRPAAESTGPATLTLQSEPWANVYVDGVLIGSSPIVEHELPAKRTHVKLVNPDAGLQKETVVDLKPGQALRMRFDLRGGAARVLP